MKITLVGPVYPYRGGIAQYTTALSQELMIAGHTVQTISFKRQYPGWLYPGQSDKEPGAAQTQVPALYILDPLYYWTWRQAVRQIRDFHPDLVIIQWWTTFWAPTFFFLSASLKRSGILCVFCIHNVIPHENRALDRWLSRQVLSRGKGFITLSSKESERLIQLLPSARVFRSRLPMPKTQHPELDRNLIRTKLGIPAGQPVLFFFGIVRPYKGLSILLDALGFLQKESIHPVLIIAGEFWENVKEYQNKIENLNLSRQIILENRYVTDDELARFFAAADVFVAPYTRGTQSAAIKMAMSYGLPILASDQIAGDLPLDSYPVSIHRAGDPGDLARSIRCFFERNEPGTRAHLDVDDWAEIVALIPKIARELSGEATLNVSDLGG